jgi:hypothetical protein
MGQPTRSQVHAIDVPLTNVSTAYWQDDDQFIATKVFPVIPVEHKTDKFYTYTKADWFRDEAKPRADASESAGSGWGMSTGSYSCDVFALHKDIGDQVRENADAGINLDSDAARFLTQRMLLRQEIQWVTDMFTTSVWATDSTPSNLWSDFTASDPIEDMETGKETILSTTGREANTLVLGYQVARKLRNHPDIIDRIKYTTGVNGMTVSNELLASMFGVKKVYVAKAIKNTAVEGETAAYSFVFGKHALLLHVPDNPGLLTPASGYTFSWRGVSYGLGSDIGIKRFRLEREAATRVEAQIAVDFKMVGSDLGYFFNGAVS